MIIAYYFFDYTMKSSLSSIAFLRCVLHQILPPERISPSIQRSIERYFQGEFNNRDPEIEEVEELILRALESSQKLLLVVDGIDELIEDERKQLFRSLKKIRQNVCGTKFWISGQSEVDVCASFCRKAQKLQIRPSDIEIDIRLFVEARLNEPLHTLYDCPTYLKEMILRELVGKAHGM